MEEGGINKEQYLEVCKRADYLYLHRLVLTVMSKGVHEGDSIHNFYHRIIFDLVEEIYKKEASTPTPGFTGIKWLAAFDGRTYSAFGKDDPIFLTAQDWWKKTVEKGDKQ